MHIRCRNCSQQYFIQESRLGSEPVYFVCEQCGDRVVVPDRHEAWDAYTPMDEKPLNIGSLIDGISLSFNIKNILMSAGFFLAVVILGTLLFSTLRFNLPFFMEHQVMSALVLLIFGTAMMFLYDLNLYLVSRNVIHRVRHGVPLLFSDDPEGISGDLPMLSFFSIIMPVLYVLVLLPLLALGRAGFLYAGVMEIPLVILGAIVLASLLFKGMICSFIALQRRSLGGFFSGIARFIATEHINIGVYTVLNLAAALPIVLVIMAIVSFAMLVPLAGTMASSSLGLLTESFRGFTGAGSRALMDFIAGPEAASLSFRFGSLLAVFSAGIIYVLIAGFFITLCQSLTTASILIMASNPGRSVPRTVLVLVLSAFLVMAIGFLFR